MCSDGLWSVMHDAEMEKFTREGDAETACRRMVEAANARGTPDNLTVSVFTLLLESPNVAVRRGWRERIARMFGRGNRCG